MADTRRDFEDYAASGEIIDLFIGGTDPEHRAATVGDLGTSSSKSSLIQIVENNYDLEDLVWQTVMFDQVQINRGDIIGNITTGAISVQSAKSVEVKIGINADFAVTEEVVLTLFRNGVEAITNFQNNFQGLGDNKPIMLIWFTTLQAADGDIFEAKISSVSGAFNLDVLHAFFEIKEDR